MRAEAVRSAESLTAMVRRGGADFLVQGFKADLSLSPANGQMRLLNAAEDAGAGEWVRVGVPGDVLANDSWLQIVSKLHVQYKG